MKTILTESTQIFWYNPKKDLVIQVPRGTHVGYVVENPQDFGFSREEISRTYINHDEPLGTEGKARDEILRRILLRGWIRIRTRLDVVFIELASMRNREDLLKLFKSDIVGYLSPEDEVRIFDLNGGMEAPFPVYRAVSFLESKRK